MTLPNDEAQRLQCAVTEAFCLAHDGRVAAGYRLLRQGLDDARISSAGYSADLVSAWSVVLDEFRRRYPAEWYDAGSGA